MNYRKVPFMNGMGFISEQRDQSGMPLVRYGLLDGMGDYYVDFVADSFLMNRGGAGPRPRTDDAMSRHRDDGSLRGYDVNSPGAGFAGLASDTKVMLRPRAGSAPGWPGFFGWLAATNPSMYNYVRVSLPNVVEDRQGFTSAGSQLGWYNPRFMNSAQGRNLNGFRVNERFSNSGEGRNLSGLGDVTSLAPSYASATAAWRAGTLNQSATEGVTDSTPMPTTTLSTQIISVLSKAAASFLPLYSQKQLLDVQITRARQGLPPLDTSQYESASQGLNVGLNRSTQSTFLMVAGLAAAAFVAVKLIKR